MLQPWLYFLLKISVVINISIDYSRCVCPLPASLYMCLNQTYSYFYRFTTNSIFNQTRRSSENANNIYSIYRQRFTYALWTPLRFSFRFQSFRVCFRQRVYEIMEMLYKDMKFQNIFLLFGVFTIFIWVMLYLLLLHFCKWSEETRYPRV